MGHFIIHHQTAIILGVYIVLSNAIATLPDPTSFKCSMFYKWFFGFSHAVLLQAGRFVNKGANNDAVQNQTDPGTRVIDK